MSTNITLFSSIPDKAPDLFSYVQVLVDEAGQPGQFILTGSQNFLLLRQITQSLAGRASILHLLPFSRSELKGRKLMDIDFLKGLSYWRRLPGNESLPAGLVYGGEDSYIRQEMAVLSWQRWGVRKRPPTTRQLQCAASLSRAP